MSGELLSGQITVTTAGIAERGPVLPTGSLFAVKAHWDNTDVGLVGNDGAGDVTNANGFPLEAGEGLAIAVPNLAQLWFDADVSGEKFCWLKLR